MQAFMLAEYFRRVEMSKCESAILQAILSKANVYGKQAKVAIVTLMAISGYCERSVQYATKGLEARGLLRVDRRKLWPTYNAINVYHVVVPWRHDPLGAPAARPWYAKLNNKGAQGVHPTPERERRESLPAISEAEATRWHTPGTKLWYWAQGRAAPGDSDAVAIEPTSG